MNYLLDTHTLIWLDSNSKQLSANARAVMANTANTLFFSFASIWEMQIKYQLGKLDLRMSLPNIISDQQQRNNIQLLSVKLAHIYELDTLLHHHNDPFDRLLVAQARVEGLAIITADANIGKYPVDIVW